MRTIPFIVFVVLSIAVQAGVQTKKFRCNANTEKITYSDPYTEQTGTTSFSDSFYPYSFQTDSLQDMQAWIATNGITIKKENGN